MSVLIEGISVVVRMDSILDFFRGGWEAFRGLVPNRTLCSDSELTRVGFMTPDDVEHFIKNLEEQGVVYREYEDGPAVDMVVVDQQRGVIGQCDWIEYGHVPLDSTREKMVAACRLKGGASTSLMLPDGWAFERSLSNSFRFIPLSEASDYLEFVRHENGVDVYRDRRTGELVYAGRTQDQ
ncbi:MAG: hypothetical protein GC159_09210 [Phycisphaera sp.]|nr:hypothetical protein [Phycisphaera sp.]